MTGIILAHGKAQKMFDLHLENWKKSFEELYVICPSDDIVQYEGLVYDLGLSEHHGYWNCERMRRACELAAQCEKAYIVEYDTLTFNLPEPDETLRGCGPMYDYRSCFRASWFTHSPWTTSQTNFEKISKYEVIDGRHEYCDRWLAEACEVLGIKPSGFDSYYSPCCGFIRDSDEWKDAVVASHSSNLSAIHGIKEEVISKTICAIQRI